MAIAELATRMLRTAPHDTTLDETLLTRCIEACDECAQACTQCADDCLGEEGAPGHLVRCIRLNMDCADVCMTTGRVVSRQTDRDAAVGRALLEACIAACRACGEECDTHARHGMEHCAVCADHCRRCAAACEGLLAAMA